MRLVKAPGDGLQQGCRRLREAVRMFQEAPEGARRLLEVPPGSRRLQ